MQGGRAATTHGNLEAGRPALLLVHPLGTGPGFWRPAIDCLPRFGWIAPDFRPAPDEAGVTLETQADWLEAERRRLGVAPGIVVGCAAGSMIAATYAGTFATRALVLANPAVRYGPAADDALAARARLVREQGMGALVPALPDRVFGGRPRDAIYARFTRELLAQDPERYARFLLSCRGADIGAALRRFRGPCLLVRGGLDAMLTEEDALAVRALVPQARYVDMPDGAHFVPLQRPEAFAALVERFVRDGAFGA